MNQEEGKINAVWFLVDRRVMLPSPSFKRKKLEHMLWFSQCVAVDTTGSLTVVVTRHLR